jgi:putative sterol carrier protein
VADFLSEEWFDEINRSLAAAGPVPDAAGTLYVVLEFTDAPSFAPHAITFALSDLASVAPGDHLAAETLLRLSYADALALTQGTFDSATALRSGRVKVRGDLNALVPLLAWLQRAHPASA